jgi:hypothetical protein
MDREQPWIEQSADGVVTISPEALAWLDRKYRALSKGTKRRWARLNSPPQVEFMMCIVWVMYRNKLEPQGAAEFFVAKLKTGEWRMSAQVADKISYPGSFWRALSQAQIVAAYHRGFWTREEGALLWRHLGRTDQPPAALRFPRDEFDALKLPIEH